MSGLRVVVFDEGDGQFRDRRRQRVLPQARQVDVAVRDRCLVEVVVQRHVEEHGVGNLMQVGLEFTHVATPVLADGGQQATRGGAQVFEPARVEVRSDVFNGIQAQRVHAGRLHIPASPAVQLLADTRVRDVHVAAHQVVEVAELGVDGLVPVLSFEEPQALALRRLVPVDAVEACPVPREVRVGAAAAREREAGPRLDHFGFADHLMAVVRVDRNRAHHLGRIRAHAVVEDDVGAHGDPRLVQGVNGGQVFVLRPVLRGDCALLVEFAQVVQVVDAVADVVDTVVSLVGGRKPDDGDAQVRDRLRVLRQVSPVARIRCHVPGESLQHQGPCLLRRRMQGLLFRVTHPHMVAGCRALGVLVRQTVAS